MDSLRSSITVYQPQDNSALPEVINPKKSTDQQDPFDGTLLDKVDYAFKKLLLPQYYVTKVSEQYSFHKFIGNFKCIRKNLIERCPQNPAELTALREQAIEFFHNIRFKPEVKLLKKEIGKLVYSKKVDKINYGIFASAMYNELNDYSCLCFEPIKKYPLNKLDNIFQLVDEKIHFSNWHTQHKELINFVKMDQRVMLSDFPGFVDELEISTCEQAQLLENQARLWQKSFLPCRAEQSSYFAVLCVLKYAKAARDGDEEAIAWFKNVEKRQNFQVFDFIKQDIGTGISFFVFEALKNIYSKGETDEEKQKTVQHTVNCNIALNQTLTYAPHLLFYNSDYYCKSEFKEKIEERIGTVLEKAASSQNKNIYIQWLSKLFAPFYYTFPMDSMLNFPLSLDAKIENGLIKILRDLNLQQILYLANLEPRNGNIINKIINRKLESSLTSEEERLGCVSPDCYGRYFVHYGHEKRELADFNNTDNDYCKELINRLFPVEPEAFK